MINTVLLLRVLIADCFRFQFSFLGLIGPETSPQPVDLVPYTTGEVSSMKSGSWPTGCTNCDCGYLESTGQWSLADCTGTTTKGYVCEFKGPVCPFGYVWIVDQCLTTKKNFVNYQGPVDDNCHGRVMNPGHELWKIDGNIVSSEEH